MKKEAEKILISCEDCEAAIIAGTAEKDPAVRDHLAQCANCQTFAEFQSSLLKLEPALDESMIPDFETVKRKADLRKQNKSRILRLVVMPMSMAAAVAIAVGVVLFDVQMQSTETANPTPVMPVKKAVLATAAVSEVTVAAAAVRNEPVAPDIWAEADETLVADLDKELFMTWDQASVGAQTCYNSMQAARSGEQWSIELNLYSEDLVW